MRVLFVCTGNSARSQMAEGFARHYGHGRVEAHSAGMEPSQLNPYAVRAMQEKGIDISGQLSKAFDWDLARQMDVVITVCSHANESCPVLPPEVRRLHWPLEDPAAATGADDVILATFVASGIKSNPGSWSGLRHPRERNHNTVVARISSGLRTRICLRGTGRL